MDIDEEGVSEVLGTILTLLITVALFGSVFATVTQLEGPDSEFNVELDAFFEYQDEANSVIILHEGGQSLDTDSLTFFLIVDDDSYRETPIEEESSWSVGDRRTLEENEREWDFENSTSVELMIRDDDTQRVVYQTRLLEEDRNIIDIRNSRIEYKHDWRDYAEPNENVTIKTEIAAPIWRSHESFDPEKMWVNASIYEDGVLEDDGSSISEDETIELEHSNNGRFERKLQIDGAARDDRYRVRINATYQNEEINEDMSIDPDYIYLHVGTEPEDFYDEELVIGRLWFEPGSPSHGDDFTIYAEVFNEGKIDQEAEWTIKDDRQGQFNSSETTTISHGAAPTLMTARYPDGIEGHGPHEINFEVDPVDDEWGGDEWEDTVYVDPNVMLVQDHIPEDLREGELMENALKGLNLDYEMYTVETDEEIENFDETLAQYSLTIWMTGNQTKEDPYLEDVQGDLIDYIEGDLKDCVTNGTLWVLGSNLDEISFGDLDEKLGVDSFGEGVSIGEQNKLINPVRDENGTYGDLEYGIGAGEYLNITELKENATENNTLIIEDESTNSYFGVGYEGVEKERTALNTFLFENITDPGQQTAMAGEVISWLSNMTTRTGVDIAVTSQKIEPTAPMFMDDVKINATLRNNGPESFYVDVRAVRNQGQEILSPDGDDRVYLPADGGMDTVTFTWEAAELGRHEFIVIADYFNEIDEVTRENNDITYKDLDVTDDNIEVNVHFSTLLVDAEEYSGNNPDEKVTAQINASFERLGHREGIDYDYHYVGEDTDGPEYEGMMQNYNAIFWVTGENENIYIGELIDYLEQDSGANVMFIGEHILDNLKSEHEENILKKMGIDSVENRVTTDVLMGEEGNNLGHGLRYRVENRDYRTFDLNDKGEVLFKCEEGEHNFASTYDDGSTKTVYMGINPNRIEEPFMKEGAFDDWPAGEVHNTSENAREEFIYTTLWYFGKRDDRAELRVTDYDIRPSSDHPHTGRSYQLDARIENIGYRSASALIRFKDGRNHVASQTVQVEGSSRDSTAGSSHFEVSPGSTTAEISWTPTHGGIRSLKVRVDPIGRTDEIEDEDGNKMMEFNNQAILEHPVYYFYDDMQNETDYWERQATIAHIDGEAPIDYLGDHDDLDTEVIGDWDWNKDEDGNNRTHGVEKVSDHARSDPNSFFMEEPVGRIAREADAFVVITIDNARSMANREFTDEDGNTMTWLNMAKESAKVLVDGLSDESVVGVWSYDQHTPDEIQEPIQLEGNRDQINSSIDGIERSNMAPIWDTIGAAYDTVQSNIEDEEYSHLTPAVVSLGEGVDNHAAQEGIPPGQIEQGSENWGPWLEMWPDGKEDNNGGLPKKQEIDSAWGKYQIKYQDYEPSDLGWWNKAEIDEDRRGLLYSDIPIFTIGLGLEHFGDPDNVDNPIEDPNWEDFTTYDEPEQGDWGDSHPYYVYNASYHEDPVYGTTEYNLWKISDTSDAEYFYAPDPENLDIIFGQIGEYLTGPQNLTSVGDPTPLDSSSSELTSDDRGQNFDKYAVTPELDLSNTSSAWLTFWHRYRLLQGVNGAYLEIGYEDDNGDLSWHYIEPSIGPYTGNLLEGEEPTDDRGKLIEWAWNGKSGDGTMDWDRVSIDLLRDDYEIPEEHLDSVRLRFYYKQFGGSNVPGGWWIDDVRVDVTRRGDWWNDDIEGDMHDVWQLKNTTGMDGEDTTAWWNGVYGEDRFKGGIDNSLITDPMDLRHAESATLQAEFKFNINEESGLPPDGFRVEVSEDGGRTWSSINLGHRAAVGDSADETTHNWTTAEDLTRLNIDLSDYSGNIILLRFRVVTNSAENYDNDLGFGGLYINNVMVVDDELRD